jgi:hypothetical protein
MGEHKEYATLSQDYPYLFYDGEPYDFSGEIGRGWHDLCIMAFGEIVDAYIEYGVDLSEFCLLQIKEKFGGLRIYVGGMDAELHDAVAEIINEAESASFKICEVCGEPGYPRNGAWIKTLCDKHANQEE